MRAYPIVLVAVGAIGGAVLAGIVVRGMAQTQITALETSQRNLTSKVTNLQSDIDSRKGNAANFSVVISKELQISGNLCILQEKWPVDIPPNGFDMGQRDQMKAFVKVGLVSSRPVETDAKDFLGKPIQQNVDQFSLTSSGKKYTLPAEQSGFLMPELGGKAICYGHRVFDKVLNWEGPASIGGPEEVEVLYSYKVQDIAPWVNDVAIQKAFPNTSLPPPSEGKATIELQNTANGWSAHGLGG